MSKSENLLLNEATEMLSGCYHVLANTQNPSELNSVDCYTFASQLERAAHLLVAVADRKFKVENQS